MWMPKDKPGWGGKRSNQTGRPQLGEKRRVQINMRIDPKTKVGLKRICGRTGESVGKLIDRLVEKEDKD